MCVCVNILISVYHVICKPNTMYTYITNAWLSACSRSIVTCFR